MAAELNFPAELKYTKDHEWVRLEGETATVGITAFAAKELGDIVYVDVDTVGDEVENGKAFGTVEAVKTVSELFMPLSGEVLEVNPELEGQPELVNNDPYGAGWMIKVRITGTSEIADLLDDKEYKKLVK